MKRWRIEYQDDFDVVVGGLFDHYHPRIWRIYHEDIREGFRLLHLMEFELLDIDIPAICNLVHLVLRDARADTIELHPYAPVDVDEEVLECMGKHFIERVLGKPRECKVWHLKNGYVWLHVPGDAAR